MTQVLVLLTFTRDWGKTPGFDLMQPGGLGDEQEVEGFPVSLIVTFKQIKKKLLVINIKLSSIIISLKNKRGGKESLIK